MGIFNRVLAVFGGHKDLYSIEEEQQQNVKHKANKKKKAKRKAQKKARRRNRK